MVRVAMTEPHPTPRRSIWLAMMTSALLVYAGVTLVEMLSLLRDPRTDTASTLEEVARASGQVEAVERLRAVGSALAAQHRRAIQIDALMAIVVSLLILYVVAAILLRDRQARPLALVAGWVGLVSQLLWVPFAVALARQLVGEGVPVLQQFLLANGMQVAGMTTDDRTTALRATIVMMPVMRAAVGIAWSLSLLIFFGGRRGRARLSFAPAGPEHR
jgi:hypothetical protein